MGNQGMGGRGGMVVRTEKNVYLPGETVSGTVYIMLYDMFPASVLTLKVKGKEDTRWQTRHTHYEGEGQHRKAVTIIKSHMGHSSFMNYKFPVFNWTQGFVPAGQYCIPFSFILPPKCPGSFTDTFKGGWAKLVYRLKAELVSMNGMAPVKGECPLYIREAVTGVTGMIADTQVPLTTCCCCSQGMAHLRAYVEKSAYCPGEIANVVLEVDNSQSSLNIKSLRCTLLWNLKVANSRSSHSLGGAMADQVLSGVAEGQAGVQKRIFQLPVSAHTNFQGIEQGTTHGRLVQMSYSIRIFADMDGCTCCDAEPCIDVPITIYFPVPVIAAPQAPNGWSPQMIPMVQLALGPQFEYASRKVGKIIEEWEGEGDPPHMGGGAGINVSMNTPTPFGSPGVNVNVNMGGMGAGVNTNVGMGGGVGMQVNMGGNPQMAYPPGGQQPQMMVQHPNQQMGGGMNMNVNMGGMGGMGAGMNVNVGMQGNMGGSMGMQGGYNNQPQMMQTNMMGQPGYYGQH